MEEVECEINKEQIYLYAEEFRFAIEKVKVELLEDQYLKWWFGKFPHGRCGDTSELLAQYFLNKGIESAFQNGRYGGLPKPNLPHGQFHAWLLYDKKYIIDITADQFGSEFASVIMTADKSWYAKFENSKQINEIFDGFQGPSKIQKEKLYQLIINKI